MKKEKKEVRKNNPFYRKCWFWMLVVFGFFILIIIHDSFGMFGPLISRTPDISMPDSLDFCTEDSDCTIIYYNIGTCCSGRVDAVNIQGKIYIDSWYKLNCNNKNLLKYWGCPYAQYDGSIVREVKCENSRCMA